MSREVRWLARELRPIPYRRRPLWWRLLAWLFRHVVAIAVVVLVVWAVHAVVSRIGPVLTVLAVGGLLAGALSWRPSRRLLVTGLGCLVTRYRLRTGLRELRLTARSGRLPLALWLWPTPVGERVWLLCPVGVSAEDIADETDRLRAACYAREVRVSRNPRWSALVVVDVIRRDPLAATATVPTPLLGRLPDIPRQEARGNG